MRAKSSLRRGGAFATRRSCAGFTLLELMIVIILLLVLVSIAIPQYQQSLRRAHEAVLRQDLFDLRKLISEYTLDKQKAPQSLDDLVQAGYLKEIPKDPMTGAADWEQHTMEEDTLMTPDEQDSGGIDDVHSASTKAGLDGTTYNTW